MTFCHFDPTLEVAVVIDIIPLWLGRRLSSSLGVFIIRYRFAGQKSVSAVTVFEKAEGGGDILNTNISHCTSLGIVSQTD